MKKFSKILSVALLVALVLSLGATAAFAGEDDSTDPPSTAATGSITVKNATKGETYRLFKLFDATLSDDETGIAYTGTIPTSLNAFFTKDAAGNIHIAAGKSQAEVAEAVQSWAAALAEAEDHGESDEHYVTKDVAEGGALVFDNLAYGYYAVTSTLGGVVSVDSTNPDAEIIDKNTPNPSAHKVVDSPEYSVGDTVTYTAVFDAPNYLPKKNASGEVVEGEQVQVVSYVIKDTLPAFLDDVTITGVYIGKFNADDNYAVIGSLQANLSEDYSEFDENKSIEIPWVQEQVPTESHTYTSLYTGGTQIKITYTATLTANANLVSANVNTVSLFPQIDKGDAPGPYQDRDEWNDSAEVTTYGAAIQKVDESNNPLVGAEFKIKGLTVTGADGLYTVVAYDKDGAADSGDVMKTDANGLLRIGGLKSGLELTVTEVKAPDGYNILKDSFKLTTTKLATTTTSTSGSVTRYYDADGNLVATQEESTSSTTTTEYTSLDNIPTDSIKVVENKKGTELPSTGGIGTTIFYVVGGILVVAAGVLLITKKRMSE